MNVRDEDEWWKSFHVPEMASLFLQRGNAVELEETIAFLLGELGYGRATACTINAAARVPSAWSWRCARGDACGG